MFLKEISDDLLVELRREGNQDAIDLLFERYRKFIYGIINDFVRKQNCYCDYGELYQESMCVFISCINKYDENSGCFYFFIRRCIERRLNHLFEKEKKYEGIISLDEYMYDNNKETKMDYVEENGKDFVLYDRLEEKIDDFASSIIELKIMGYTYEEISNILGVETRSIYRKINKIKKKLKDITKN